MKESADEVLEALGIRDDLLDIAKELEEVALADDYFIERQLLPERRLLYRRDLQGDRGSTAADVYCAVCDRTGLDCALA